MRLMRNLISGLLDLTYPKTCYACKKKISGPAVNGFVCAECWVKIKINTPPFCQSCGRSLTGKKSLKNICLSCIKKPLHFDRAFSPCSYEGVIKDLIHTFKYKNKDYLGAALSKPMAAFIREYNLPMEFIDAIVPVPLHKTRLREREFNHAYVLSRHLGLEFNKTVLEDNLLRRRNTPTQTELKDQERFLNVKGCFQVAEKKSVKGLNILLVDDVLTTGATSSEAALALKEAGANIVYVLTLAN